MGDFNRDEDQVGEVPEHRLTLPEHRRDDIDQIAGQARTQADQLLAEVKADAERRRAAAQREADELTRQKDSIAGRLALVRQLLGGQLPGMETAVQAAQPVT